MRDGERPFLFPPMKHEITDQGDPKKYWTQIPNIVYTLSLKPFELALYNHLKWAAGASPNGKCTKSTATLARESGMGTGTISRAKTELEKKRVELGNKPLVKTREIPNPRGGKAFQEISITDIWKVNVLRFTSSTEEIEETDQVPVEVEPSSRPISTGEINKNSKQEQRKEERERDFLSNLKSDPLYSHVDFDFELAKMQRWLAEPRNKGRKLTERFVLTWLNKIDRPLNFEPSNNGHHHRTQAEIARDMGYEYNG